MIGSAPGSESDQTADGAVTVKQQTGWWPTFNLADTFLIIGFIVIALLHLHAERMARNAMPPV